MAPGTGEETLGPAPKDPWEELCLLRFSSVPDLDSSAMDIEGWRERGGLFSSPELVPQKSGDIGLWAPSDRRGLFLLLPLAVLKVA